MRFGRRKTADLVDRGEELIKAGANWSETAKALGVTWDWVYYHVGQKAGVRPVPRLVVKASPENLARARELRAAGTRWKVIERIMGIEWRLLARAIYQENQKCQTK